MKLSVNVFVSLDGVMQGPGGFEEDRSGGFERGGWLVPLADEGFGEVVDGWFRHAGAILLGRTTYDMMFAYWSRVTDPDNIVAEKLNGLPKYVASRTLREPEWQHTTVLADDAIERIRELKEQPGDGELQVHGSCGLARQLHEAGLIDEYRLLVFPVVVGDGKRLFPDGSVPSGFDVVDSRITPNGATYVALTPKPFVSGSEFTVVDGKESVG